MRNSRPCNVFLVLLLIVQLWMPFSVKAADATFFPIGIFQGVPVSAYPELAESGFNVVQRSVYFPGKNENLSEEYSAARLNGLKILLDVPQSIYGKPGLWGSDQSRAALRNKWIMENMAEKSLLAWTVASEPEHRNISPVFIANETSAVKAIDTAHPTALIINDWGQQAAQYSESADILMLDPYQAFGNGDIRDPSVAGYYKMLKTFKNAQAFFSSGKPVWVIVGIHNMSQYNPEFRPGRTPNYEEIRSMAYLSVVKGATGIFFYNYKASPLDSTPEHPGTWYGAKKVAKEISLMADILLSPSIGAGTVAGDAIHYVVKNHENHNYIIAVNTQPRAFEANIQVVTNEPALKTPGENRLLAVVDGRIQDRFNPFAVHIYTDATKPPLLDNVHESGREAMLLDHLFAEGRKNNLAARDGVVVTASSVNERNHPTTRVTSAIDGIRGSAWVAKRGSASTEWLNIKLKKRSGIGRVVVEGNLEEFSVQSRIDGPWSNHCHFKDNDEKRVECRLSEPVKANEVRIWIPIGPSGKRKAQLVRINEVELYEK